MQGGKIRHVVQDTAEDVEVGELEQRAVWGSDLSAAGRLLGRFGLDPRGYVDEIGADNEDADVVVVERAVFSEREADGEHKGAKGEERGELPALVVPASC